MTAIQTQKWDAATYLRTEEDMTAYLDAVQAEDDSELMVAALSDVARAQGTLTVDDRMDEHNGE